MKNSLSLTPTLLSAIEDELRGAIAATRGAGLEQLRHMLAYHMGWEGEGSGMAAQGKRIRPLLLLLTCASAGGEWQRALPAAAAVELIHNFSLIHDDIEDHSPLRRGRPTLWVKWGVAQAVNTGDTLFTLAHLALLRLSETTTQRIALLATRNLQATCLHLTQGQHIDIAFEDRQEPSLEEYWTMVEGKTAALLAASAALGALVANAADETRAAYQRFGRALGLAFQAQDDLLGIWGDAALTGKSAESDLMAGKKSLPVLFGLQQNGEFARRWRLGKLAVEEIPALARQLETEGARRSAEEAASRWTDEAQSALKDARPRGEAAVELSDLVTKLIGRTV